MSARVSHNLVTRADGKQIKVVRKTGQLFVCSDACCCGQVDSANPAVPLDQLQTEWEQRKLRNKVHLTIGGCLGPCDLANVAMLLFDGRSIWLHSFHTAEQVTALYDYIEAMLQVQSFLPTPPSLQPYEFNAFDWYKASDDCETAEPNEVSAR
jgi:cobaltochelatase CobN